MKTQATMARDIERNRDNPDVLEWIREHPPPEEWQGTDLEWAWLESPSWLWRGLESSLPFMD